jgi:hypothetical protein
MAPIGFHIEAIRCYSGTEDAPYRDDATLQQSTSGRPGGKLLSAACGREHALMVPNHRYLLRENLIIGDYPYVR